MSRGQVPALARLHCMVLTVHVPLVLILNEGIPSRFVVVHILHHTNLFRENALQMKQSKQPKFNAKEHLYFLVKK